MMLRESGPSAAEVAGVEPWVWKHRVAAYVAPLRRSDEVMRARIMLHHFGLVWETADQAERRVLVAEEPELFDERWDAFLAAYTEHLCYHARLDVPGWVYGDGRYLARRWFGVPCGKFQRGSVMMATPAAFEVHGIYIAARELVVV